MTQLNFNKGNYLTRETMIYGYFPKLSQESSRKPLKSQMHAQMLGGGWEKNTVFCHV